MLALFAIFEHLPNVRHLLNRFHALYTSTTKSDEQISSDSISIINEQEHDVLLGPILHNILSDNRLNNFDKEFHEELEEQDYFARELDACLLEMREIERDIYNLKQRQSPTTKQLRRKSTIYEFNIPVSNRFELLKRQHTQNFE
jgi:hypothetical protein